MACVRVSYENFAAHFGEAIAPDAEYHYVFDSD
jgi:hypothetical protein